MQLLNRTLPGNAAPTAPVPLLEVEVEAPPALVLAAPARVEDDLHAGLHWHLVGQVDAGDGAPCQGP